MIIINTIHVGQTSVCAGLQPRSPAKPSPWRETPRCAVLFLAAALAVCSAAITDDQIVTRTFPVAPGVAPEIVVNIVTGSIRVTTHAAATVELNAKVHLESAGAASLAALKNHLRLESEQSGHNIWIGLESTGDTWSSPRSRRELGWRNKTGAPGTRNRGDGGNHDRFRHDIELRVPRSAHLKLRTVNGGNIEVDGVEGEFDFNNVNGGIAHKGGAGFGRAHTVNGPVTLSLTAQPAGPLSVKTVNGAVRLSTPRNLNANVQLKTLHGKVHTDFAMSPGVPSTQQPAPAEQGMKRIWRANSFSPGRIGDGSGPAIEISTLNGDIDILENKN